MEYYKFEDFCRMEHRIDALREEALKIHAETGGDAGKVFPLVFGRGGLRARMKRIRKLKDVHLSLQQDPLAELVCADGLLYAARHGRSRTNWC